MSGEKKVELLAPAGNVNGFYGAVRAGADAVYLGGSRFGARAYAENFTTKELTDCIRYGHLFGRKVYLTVNTLFKESEIGELFDYLAPFYEAGLDAVIVQDMGVLRFIRECFPGLKLHASTQMTLCSGYGAMLLKQLGAVRIVPARELSLEELVAIKGQTGMELETFIHGAMCYCYSGQCLFSSMLGGRSGNRGRCAQPCRLPYEVRTDQEKSGVCYPLSLKDMCTIEHLPRLIEAGLDSFKIEGRMKKPEYAAGVTAIYRRYIDRYYEWREKYGAEEAFKRYQVSQKDLEALSSLYIRSEKQDGYYFRRNGREMVTLSSPAYSGGNEAYLAQIKARYLEEHLKHPIRISAVFLTGRQAEVTLHFNDISVTAVGDTVQKAQKQPVTEENVAGQLSRMGDSAFVPESMELTVGTDVFYPLGQMNELRRQAVAKLEQALLEQNGYPDRSVSSQDEKPERQGMVSWDGLPDLRGGWESHPKPEYTGLVCSVRTEEQLQAVAEWQKEKDKERFKRIYIDGDLFLERMRETVCCCEKLAENPQIYLALPYILRKDDDSYLGELESVMERSPFLQGVLARSLDGMAYAFQKRFPIRLDAGVYSWNSASLAELGRFSRGFCLPFELNEREQRQLLDEKEHRGLFEKIIYARIPMMITANCIRKTVSGCRKQTVGQTAFLKDKGREEFSVLIDRYRKEFPTLTNCRHCYNVIYNSVPLSLHQSVEKWRGKADLRLDFTTESGKETRRILEAFFEQGAFPCKEHTTGHEKRGVE